MMSGEVRRATAARGLSDLPRQLGEQGQPGAATLVCVGGLHGNERPGVLALQRIFERLEANASGLIGRIVGLAGNRAALARDQRFQSDDLNRIWTQARVARVRTAPAPDVPEDEELRALSAAIDAELERSDQVSVLDLHSTSGQGPAFTTLDDTLANRVLAFALPAVHVLGLEEELSGTMIGSLNERGVTAIGFEAGQHDAPESIERAEAAIWIAMETCGVLAKGARPEVAAARKRLTTDRADHPAVVEIRYRHPVHAGDGFVMQPGFVNFQSIRKGQLLATSASGPIPAPLSGMMLMPLYQSQGNDGFFIIRRVNPAWLAVSAAARRLRIDRFVHWLPGIRRHPELAGAFLVDSSRARWFALQCFHLLGFKRRTISGSILELVRRDGN